MVQLILEAAQGAPSCECIWILAGGRNAANFHKERIPVGQMLASAAFAALVRVSAQSRAAAFQLRLSGFEGHVLQPKIPFFHVHILNEKRYYTRYN